MAALNFTLALILALALGSSASATPFPCGTVDPCADDPNFLFFGLFTCESAPFDPCGEPEGLFACGKTCLSCPICQEPIIPLSVFAVFQAVEVVPNVLSVFLKNSVPVAGVQAQVGCTVNGKSLSFFLFQLLKPSVNNPIIWSLTPSI